MHLRNVEIFCDVVSLRSFSRAAKAHDVSQSSASQAVLQLDRRLGTELIDRSKRPFELTEAGELYFDGCRKLLDSYRKIEDRVRQLRNRVVGEVRVAAIYSVGLLQMDGCARRFSQLYPDADVQLEYLHPDDVYARVLADEADLGLVSLSQDEIEALEASHPGLEDVLPLSPLQEGLLFHALYEAGAAGGGDDVYTVQIELALEGALDGARLAASAQALLARHASLRAGFCHERLSRPVQVIASRALVTRCTIS